MRQVKKEVMRMEQLSVVSLETGTGGSGLPFQNPAASPKEFRKSLTAATSEKEKTNKNVHNSSDSEKVEDSKDETEETQKTTEDPAAALFFTGFLTAVQEQTSEKSAIQLTKVENADENSSQQLDTAILTSSDAADRGHSFKKEAAFAQLTEDTKSSSIVAGQSILPRDSEKSGAELKQPSAKQAALLAESLMSTPVHDQIVNGNEEKGKKMSKETEALITAKAAVSVANTESQTAETFLPTGRFMSANWKTEKELPEQMAGSETQKNHLQDLATELELETVQPSKEGPFIDDSQFGKDISQTLAPPSTDLAGEEPQAANMSESKIQDSPLFNGVLNGMQQGVSESTSAARQQTVQMVKEVIAEITETFKSSSQSSAEVSISPERMGTIRIKLELTDHVLSTKIVVDSLKTQELLNGSIQQLTDNLNRQQIQLGEVMIQLNTNGEMGFNFAERQAQEQKKQQPCQAGTVTVGETALLKAEENTVTQPGRLSILV